MSGRSETRQGIFGEYVIHFDESGKKIGESHEIDGFFGPYTEHLDTNYSKVGESRDIDGFLGPYTEHRDTNYSKVGESRDIDGFLGPYTEHRDTNYSKVGESRDIDGFLGPYTEHHGDPPVSKLIVDLEQEDTVPNTGLLDNTKSEVNFQKKSDKLRLQASHDSSNSILEIMPIVCFGIPFLCYTAWSIYIIFILGSSNASIGQVISVLPVAILLTILFFRFIIPLFLIAFLFLVVLPSVF